MKNSDSPETTSSTVLDDAAEDCILTGKCINSVISLAALLKKARQDISMVSNNHDEYRSKWQDAATLDEDKLTLIKKTVLELRKLLA